MKTASTPIEIWHSVPTLRTFLKDNNIIAEDSDGKITIPTFKCNIEKPTEGLKTKSEIKMYPFYHQKMQFMLDSMNGDYAQVCESWNFSNNSFLCGKSMDITITLI